MSETVAEILAISIFLSMWHRAAVENVIKDRKFQNCKWVDRTTNSIYKLENGETHCFEVDEVDGSVHFNVELLSDVPMLFEVYACPGIKIRVGFPNDSQKSKLKNFVNYKILKCLFPSVELATLLVKSPPSQSKAEMYKLTIPDRKDIHKDGKTLLRNVKNWATTGTTVFFSFLVAIRILMFFFLR